MVFIRLLMSVVSLAISIVRLLFNLVVQVLSLIKEAVHFGYVKFSRNLSAPKGAAEFINQLKALKYSTGTAKGFAFEKELCILLRQLGRDAHLVSDLKSSGRIKVSGFDDGADILIYSNNRIQTVIQAKCYKNGVNNSAVQEVHAARSIFGADSAIIITTSFLTKPAAENARKLGIDVIDWEQLCVLARKAYEVA